MATGNIAVTVFRWLLVLVIILCFLTFFWAAFGDTCLYWYNDTPWSGTEPAWQLHYHAMEDRYSEAGATVTALLYGSDAVGLFGMCASTLIAALATFVLRSLPERPHKQPNVGDRIWSRVKQVFHWQLPPRKLWLWWSGGMSVLDAFILCSVLALGAIWTEQLTIGYFRYLDGLVDYGTFETYYADLTMHEAKLEAVANRTGWLALAGALALFFPIPRSSFLQALFKVDFSYLIRYHRWFGHVTMLGTAIHGVIYYVAWGIERRFSEQFKLWQPYTISNLAGNLSFLFGIILWVSCFAWVRRHFFEWFYKLHIIGFLGFYIFGFIHYNGFFYYSLPGFVMYLLDVTFRLAQWMNVSIITGSLVSKDVLALQLNFDPATELKPNSFVFLAVPDASRSQWHPFTLSIVRNSTDAKQPAQATIFVKPYGSWAQALVRRIADKGTALVKIDGPYGGTSTLADSHCPVAVVFAGGIGVTPMLGLLSSLRERRLLANKNGLEGSGPEKIIFIWANRNPVNFNLLDDDILAEARNPDSWLDIRLFNTSSSHEANGNDLCTAPVNDNAKEAMVSLQKSGTQANSCAIPADAIAHIDRPELKLASPFFLKPGLLQGYGIGYFLWGLTHALAFFGAFYCVLVTNTYYSIQGSVNASGAPYWLWNILSLVALTVGTMGFPALIIFPVFLWRHHRSQRLLRKGALQAPGMLPPWQSNDQAIKMEAGTRTSYNQGRPDIRSILKNVQADYSHLSEIHVIAAGPGSMVRDVKLNCADLSPVLNSAPQLVYEIDSFAL